MTRRTFGNANGSGRQLMTLRQIAERGFGKSAAWIYRRIELFRALGFPDPFPGTSEYDPKAVDLWMDSLMPKDLRQLLAGDVDPMGHGAGDDEITAARSRLQKRLEERTAA
jgi:hypothetical protein